MGTFYTVIPAKDAGLADCRIFGHNNRSRKEEKETRHYIDIERR